MGRGAQPGTIPLLLPSFAQPSWPHRGLLSQAKEGTRHYTLDLTAFEPPQVPYAVCHTTVALPDDKAPVLGVARLADANGGTG